MESIFPGLTAVSNIHPLFVHFPVALLPSALVVQLLALWRGDAFLHRMARGLVYMGTVGAIVAVATGFMATAKMGHEAPGHDLVHLHRDFMVATAALSVVLSALLFFIRARGGASALVGTVGLIFVVGLLGLGADRGGRLVFKHGIGVRFVPPPASHHTHGKAGHGHSGSGATGEPEEHEEHGEHGEGQHGHGPEKQAGHGHDEGGEHEH